MSDATMEDFAELATKVSMGTSPILPQPTWGQDAAYIAFVIDGLVAQNKRALEVVEAAREVARRSMRGSALEILIQAIDKMFVALARYDEEKP